MHDIDSTARELVDELLDTEHETLEPEIYGGPTSGDSETDLASELLEISDEAELDQFLGKIIKGAGRLLKSPAGKMLTGALKGVAKKALPLAGSALGNLVVPGVGGAVGGRLASALGSSFGLEAEALSEEEAELEVAKGVVRVAKQAARKVARDPRASSSPKAAVRDAVAGAVAENLPGLLAGTSIEADGTAQSGRWVRRGNRIILFGV